MTAVPTLETEHLVLRGLCQDDFEAFAEFYGSEASGFVGGPIDHPLAWRKLAGYAGGWVLRGFGQFAVEEKASGKFAGLVGPWFPEGWPEPEIAWTVFPEFQSRGIALEAARRALQFAYEFLGWKTAVSCMDPANKPSIALAKRMGATLEGETEIKPYGRALLYRHMVPAQFLQQLKREGVA